MSNAGESYFREEPSQDAGFADLQNQLGSLQDEINLLEDQDPELALLVTQRVALEDAIQKADLHRDAFMKKSKQLPKGAYIREEKLLREDMALQQKLAVEVARLHRHWISTKIASLDTQYRQYKNDLLPNIKDAQKQQLLTTFLQKIQQLKQEGEHMLAESSVFHDFIKLMENKKYQCYWELVKLDPWERYDKEEREKAKRYATQGPARDVKYALQYLGGNPVTQADKGKCAVTDEHIDRDEATMKNIVTTAQQNAKNKKEQELIVWTSQSIQDIPVSMDGLEKLANAYTSLGQELREHGFATPYLEVNPAK